MRDFYKVLGIASTADEGRIKSAFRRRAKAFHPDLNPGDKGAEDRFRELTQAYEVLRSAHARACYDAYRSRRRAEARRRFASSAAMMVASFMLTLGSGYAVLAWHDARDPFRDGRQLAMSLLRVTDSTTSAIAPIAVASATPAEMRTTGMEIAKVLPARQQVAARPWGDAAKAERPAAKEESATVEWAKTTSVRRHDPEAEAPLPAKARSKVVVATHQARKPSPTAAERKEPNLAATGEANWWPWPDVDGSYMGLGASNR